MLLSVALVFPALLMALLLGMEQVERRLGRGMLADQVDWMLRSELPVEQVESSVTQRLDASLEGSRSI
ncbi:MAG: hypothetical protein QOG60_636 [Frankiaceae bacterium]|nr:hypothetical protein [Frankiaceae bacterium]